MQRKAKENDFDMIPISDIIQNLELNPFESSTILKYPEKLFYDIGQIDFINQ